jgi:hypothetical protein
MEGTAQNIGELLEFVVEHIDIPKSMYDKAAGRHRSLGDWLKRENGTIRQFDPDIRPQGSFRLGTVNRPINEGDEYDLDNVCVLTKLEKTDLTQEQVKHLYGEEIKAYAKAQGMLAPVTEHNRCWRLQYADEVNFHLDTLPCVPEELAVIQRLIAAGVPSDLARRAIGITDRRHPQYRVIAARWLSSNPRGFAKWFERRAALGRTRMMREGKIRATVEEVPPYEWKTPLQRSIQILKRHRDVMYRRNSELAPISMIITNLAARSYEGETDIGSALAIIIEKMPNFVRSERPRVPNPADPAEDYADKWATNPLLEKAFWEWHYALKTDMARIARLLGTSDVDSEVRTVFDVRLSQEELRRIGGGYGNAPSIVTRAAPAVVIRSAPRPWGVDE